MPKKFFKRVFPSPDEVKANRSLRFLSPLFANANLWHLNRRSVTRAFFIGLFMAFVPMPMQMGGAALLAFWFKANVPISVGLVWISNPLTIPPLFYGTYVFGTWLLDSPQRDINIELSVDWFLDELIHVWQPLLAGSLTIGLVLGILGYVIVDWMWRHHVWQNWKRRSLNRKPR